MPGFRDLKGNEVRNPYSPSRQVQVPPDVMVEVPPAEPSVHLGPPVPAPTPPNTEAVLKEMDAEIAALQTSANNLRRLMDHLRRAVIADTDAQREIDKLAEAVMRLKLARGDGGGE